MHKEYTPSNRSRSLHGGYNPRPETAVTNTAPQMYTSAQLNGFETSSPVSGYPGGAAGAVKSQTSQPQFPNPSQNNVNQQHSNTTPPANTDNKDEPQNEYIYRAKAMYS